MLRLAVGALALVATLTGAFAAQQWGRAASIELEFANYRIKAAEGHAAQLTEALKQVAAHQETAHEAVKKAESRAAANARAAADARAVADSLRGDLTTAQVRLRTASVEAVREYAATAGAVLDQCQGAFAGMAEKAAGHAADVQTLIDHWPLKEPAP